MGGVKGQGWDDMEHGPASVGRQGYGMMDGGRCGQTADGER